MAARRPLNLEEELLEQPSPTGHGRTIAAMVAHIHGTRKMFAKRGGVPVGPSLDRRRLTPAEARRARGLLNTALVTLFGGQIMLRARELGHAFPADDIVRIWGWKRMGR